MRVLIVEDEPAVADLLMRALREVAWAPDIARTGTAALQVLAVNEYDLAVLDIALPDIDGFEVCRRWRKRGGNTPILMLTARHALGDPVTGLDAGADDYLTKPFAIEELLARLRALARRPPSALAVTLELADLDMNTASRTVRRGNRPITLTAREYGLLEYLMRNTDHVVTRGQILAHVWDDNFDPVGNVVDALIARLRRKLDLPGMRPLIHTVRGIGYRLTDREPTDAD